MRVSVSVSVEEWWKWQLKHDDVAVGRLNFGQQRIQIGSKI
jgi:hypothetical protein